MHATVGNTFPSYTGPQRVAIIGGGPSKDDLTFGQPFIGKAGNFLGALLSRAGLQKNNCYQGFVVPSGDPWNGFVDWTSDEVQESLYQLKKDMEQFKPNIVVLFGNLALKAAKDPMTPLGKKFGYSMDKWRGSLFMGAVGGPFEGLKCIATYPPTHVLYKDYDCLAYLQFDLRKAARESSSPILSLPQRQFITDADQATIRAHLKRLRADKRTVAIDIEGGIDSFSCISFADTPQTAFIVPIYTKAGDVLIDAATWKELALTLEDSSVPKILQNSLYDRFVLHYSYGIRVNGVIDDTMLKHWELYSELEKSLGVQASIYTDEPFYKGDRKSDDDKTFYEYCCRDSAVTLEINERLSPLITGKSLEHYRLNMDILNPILYMELRGIRYDEHGADRRRADLRNKLHEAQAKLNALTGYGFGWTSFSEIQQHANALFYTKKGDRVRKEYQEAALVFRHLTHLPNPDLATIGELEDVCEVSLNVGSAKQFQYYLYDILKLPTQMSNIRGKEPHPTSDYEALLNLSRWCIQQSNEHGFQVCQAAIEIRALQTRQQMLSISADNDGRIRCGYNLVGTNTGRITCYESPTGSGYNLQTIPNYQDEKDAPGHVCGDRDLFLADEGYYLFQCDLAGADGWTVAAYCAMLGDTSMLDDYRASIKPYAKLALKIGGRDLNYRDRDEVKAAIKKWKMSDIEKLCAKRVQHGGAYLEGGLTISRNILKDSEGKTYMSPKECDALKRWYIEEMYPGMPKWHAWIDRRLQERPVLVAASGQVRQFFDRPDSRLTKAVAFEPQANTTYATNLAAWRLWTDKENRLANGRLRVEPLHQVHDALIGQFRVEDTEWAVAKIREWFNNPLNIAGQQIVIPFEGNYGLSWGNLKVGTI
jgi:uracil-DNA glycosylase family 4